MSNNSDTVDLLNPTGFFRDNYIHQLRQTIDAYSDSMIIIGEALQNAIDGVCKDPKPDLGKISVNIDFDSETVTVTDNGTGFPRDVSLLFLGGTNKEDGQKTKGKIGVGIKVVMFSSEFFCLRGNSADGTLRLEIDNAHQFQDLDTLPINNPSPDDPTPLKERGTEVFYRFAKNDKGKTRLDRFIDEIVDMTLPRGLHRDFGKTLSVNETGFPSPFCGLFASFLRRYSYVGDILEALGRQRHYPNRGIELDVSIQCSNPKERFGDSLGEFFGSDTTHNFKVETSYMRVEDSLNWIPKGRKAPKVFQDKLGLGGTNLYRTDGFNSLMFTSEDEYELLLMNKNRKLPENIEEYKRRLFPHINGILLTIGRIPDFERFLPSGSRRIISCNGIVTSHDIDVTSGQDQQYVRCFDFVIDLDAELNYGKTQLTNKHLVKWARDYVNEVYRRVIYYAAGQWVGKLPGTDDDDQEIFIGRKDLGLSEFMTRKVPSNENDVIGLFFELSRQGLFSEYRIFGLSSKEKYDCRAAIQREVDVASVL